MKRVATAVVLIPIVLLLILRAPIFLLAAVVAVVAVLTARELLDLSTHYNIQPLRIPTYIAIAIVFLAVAIGMQPQTQLMDAGTTMLILLATAALSPFIFLAIGMKREQLPTAFPAALASVFALAYVAIPLALLVVVCGLSTGGILLLYLFLVVWAGDTFAYYTGRTIGRHKLAPHVSPGKTWEGTIASFLGSIFVGWLVLTYARSISEALLNAHLLTPQRAFLAPEPLPIATIVILSAAINIAAQLGDLVESLIKRGAGVKDSGALLPGHGGMLDRIDALLFAAPVLWYYAAWRVMS
jgi:phosphatidate cytidylyltransferase